MRCPHCGYNSFAYLPRCKKCGGALQERNAQLSSVKGETKDHLPVIEADVEVESLVSEAEIGTHAMAEENVSPVVEFEPRTDLHAFFGVDNTRDNHFDPEAARATESEVRECHTAYLHDVPEPKTMDASISSHAVVSASDNDPMPWEMADSEHPAVGKSSLVTRRFIASVVDIAVILGMWLLFYSLGYKLLWGEQGQVFAPLLSSPRIRVGFYLLFVLIALGYFSLFHYANGQTLGKKLMRIKVVSFAGGSLSLMQVLLRTCGGFVSALCLGTGYMAIWFSAQKRGWNDQLADTEVVSVTEVELRE